MYRNGLLLQWFLLLIYMYDNSEPGGIPLSQKYLGSGHWIQNANDS